MAAADDAALLRTIIESTLSALASSSWMPVVLHGDPHAGNLVLTSRGSIWIELESVCLGPLEWDLSAMPAPAIDLEHDQELLGLLRRLRRACLVAWCAAKPEPQSDDLEAIAHHLGSLRGSRST